MAEYTENLELELPDREDQYNVDVWNSNSQKIDDFAGLTPPLATEAFSLKNGAKINGVNFKGNADVITGLGLYSNTATYDNTNICYIYSNGKILFYKSLQNGNTGHNPLTETSYWERLPLGDNERNLGELVRSSLPLFDSSLHLADGSVLSATDYPEFINYVASLYSKTSTQMYSWFMTEVGYFYTKSLNPYLNRDLVYVENGVLYGVVTSQQSLQPSSDPYKITIRAYATGLEAEATRASSLDKNMDILSSPFCTETEWQSFNTVYSECGYYVYNSETHTVRLPLYNSYFTNTVNPQKLGELTPASIPNIKGTVDNLVLQSSTTSFDWTGAFYNAGIGGDSLKPSNTTQVGTNEDNIGLDASRLSSVYSDTATTVNTQSIKQLVYIVVKK